MIKLYPVILFCLTLSAYSAFAADTPNASIDQRLEELEEKVQKLETSEQYAPQNKSIALGEAVVTPNIEVVLVGQYGYFSQDAKNIPGFQTGDEGMRYDKGFSIQDSAIRLSANVDHMFEGVLTFAIVDENGDDKAALEEAFIKTIDLPFGATIKAGRLLPIFGYLNEYHKHDDDFVDRPLPYRAYLNDGFNDDGIHVSIVLPTVFYSEIGGGIFRGHGFPAKAESNSPGLVMAYARVGGGVGISSAWRLGAYYLYANSKKGRDADGLVFIGNNNLYSIDFKYTYSPTSDNKTTEFVFQAEYLFRNEKGDFENAMASAAVNTKTSGLYAQAVYRFKKNYRLGYRYALLDAPQAPRGFENTSLDAGGRNPRMHSLMAEYNISKFGRFRLQYNNSRTNNTTDQQVILNYTVSFGANDD